MSHVSAIVLAAGKGLRFRSDIPKPLVGISAKPIIVYSLAVLNKHPSVKDIIVVANDKNLKKITDKIRDYRIKKVKCIIKGGPRRQDSVANALRVLDSRTDIVLIHDAARPFIGRDLVASLIKEAARRGAAIAGVPVTNTIKRVTRTTPGHIGVAGARLCAQAHKGTSQFKVKETLDRSNLWEIQTPQVFKKDLIMKAYRKSGRLDVTDDAMLVEQLGSRVSVVLGSYDNIKITTPEDIVIAEAILKSQKTKAKSQK